MGPPPNLYFNHWPHEGDANGYTQSNSPTGRTGDEVWCLRLPTIGYDCLRFFKPYISLMGVSIYPYTRRILRVSWTAKKTNEWVLNKAGVNRELLDTVKARKLAYYGQTMRKQGNCLEKEIMQGTMPGARRRGRPRMAWINNIKSWTGLSVEESIRMTEVSK